MDRVWLSRAITLTESKLHSDQQLAAELMDELLPYAGNSVRIGITGVPGVGKSTFIESFGNLLIKNGESVAVLAIDPSSERTKGSILGDKTRMNELSKNTRAYIRPSPARGTLGGVAAKTREAMLLCEATGFSVIIVETVGVGQSETLVRGMVDFFLLLMLPGAGDELQGIKKGIMEMADALVINKADGENEKAAKRALQEYKQALHLFPPSESGWRTRALSCSALHSTDLENIWTTIKEFQSERTRSGWWEKIRADQNVHWMYSHIEALLKEEFEAALRQEADDMTAKVRSKECTPLSAATRLFELYKQKK